MAARRRSSRPPADARRAAFSALVALHKGSVSRLRAALDTRALGARDLALAYELAQGCVRNQVFLDHALQAFTDRGLPADPHLLCALRLGAYQLLFAKGVREHAAVHETVALVRRGSGFCNAVLRAMQRAGLTPERVPLPPGDAGLAIRYSLPLVLVRRWRQQFGDRVESLARASTAVPAVHLRVHRRAGSREEIRARLLAEGVLCEEAAHPDLLRWVGGASPFATGTFAAGGFVAQDPTALAAVDALGARPGETVADLCAAPGTKASRLAELVGPEGRVLALDPDPRRRARIAETARRLQMPWLQVVDKVEGPVDRVLVDVPCSNTGVLARRVEVRHRFSEAALESLTATQAEILGRGLSLLRSGGCLVYSTCSLEPEENRELVGGHLPAGFALVAEELVLPEAGIRDGGYYAVVRSVAGLPDADPLG